MALNQTNKLVWIVETIYRAHKISFEELNRRWMDNVDLSRGEEMLKRTFHKWKWNIFDTFGLSTDCEKTAPYRYYIANEDDMKSGSIGNWLLSTLSVSNFLLESKMFETSQVGLMVWDLSADSCIYQRNERQLMRPASTLNH